MELCVFVFFSALTDNSLTSLFVCVITSGAKVYERVKRVREDERRKRTMLCDVLQYIQDGKACQQWLSKQAAM